MVTLIDLPVGKKGIIKAINGGHNLLQKLDNMGIRSGTEITKISRQWNKGPVTIRFGNNEIAIGHGMAGKIMIELI